MGANIVVLLQVLSEVGGEIVEGSPCVSEVGIVAMTGWRLECACVSS
jgi:hypothetical protein